MKVVILAGGLGTRISEETKIKPKPMVEIGGKPILWHIMKHYSKYGHNEFIICCGYLGHVIKHYFASYHLINSDVKFDFSTNDHEILNSPDEDWKVSLIDTGKNTLTGGRIKRIESYLGEDEEFLLTYGDGLSNVNINDVISFHKAEDAIATLTAVQAPGRFGALGLNEANVVEFKEKPKGDGSWINGGFFVLKRKVFDYLTDDRCIFEEEPLSNLAIDGELVAYKHFNFWHPIDTLRDKVFLDNLCSQGQVPWTEESN
jgi:glucose-1-phosphate cytidylyltransferase